MMPRFAYWMNRKTHASSQFMDSTFAATATLGTTATNADLIEDSNVQLKFKTFI